MLSRISQSFFLLLPPALWQGTYAAASYGNDTEFASRCADLGENLQLPNTTVWFTEHVTPGTNITFPDNDKTCTRSGQVVNAEMCRVVLLVTTSATSNLSVEAWLPSNWTGRFLSTGNGGMAGCIQYEDVAYGVQLGFATVGTNNGHNGTSGLAMFHNPGVLEDYVYRSVHVGAALGKDITKDFYGRSHTKSYYLGCSTGGRQGFKEAQDFPDDFDGIVAGAPAIRFNGLQSRSGSFWAITGPPESPTFLDSGEWALVNEDVLTQCDELDGVKDGIIEDPNLCEYRPEALICSDGESEGCLTSPQIETVRQVFSPLYGKNGTFIYPRVQPGGSEGFSFVVSNKPFPYSTEWFRYVVYEDANWDPSTIGPEDYDFAAKQNKFNAETWKGDLSDVRDRGSKIIHYHGLQDGLISPEISQVYYDHVSRTMNLDSTELDEFYRFFRISGCGHCSGGSGASNIGNNLANLGGIDPENNVLLAIVRWVEEGIPPDTLTGYRYTGGSQLNEVEYMRKHCRYPSRNVWDRQGDPKDPDSWSCQI